MSSCCRYDKLIEIDLSSIRPRINGPFTPDRSYTIDEFGEAVKQEGWPKQVGSCHVIHAVLTWFAVIRHAFTPPLIRMEMNEIQGNSS